MVIGGLRVFQYMAMADLNRSRVVAIAIAIVLAAHLSAVGRADDETGAPSSSEKTPLAALVEDLKSDDLEKRRDAAIAIGRLDAAAHNEALPALIDRIAEDKDPQVRLSVLEILTALGPDAAPAADALAHAVSHEFGGRFAEEQHGRFRAALALAAGQMFGTRTPLTRLIEADVVFHSAIHVLSGNRAIVETVADQWPHFRRSMGLVLSVSGAQARYWDEHAAILEAILAGDATAAEQRARRHTAAAGEATARQLEALAKTI